MLVGPWTIGTCCILNLRMPLKLASGKQQNIVKSRIQWMQISDALKGRAVLVIKNDVTCIFWLITITWKNDSNLIVGGIGEIVTATVTGLIKAQSYLALLFWRHIPCELIGLPIHLNCRMTTVEHVLEGDHGVMIRVSIPGIGHPKVDCISWIIHIQLSIYGWFSFWWKKRASLVGQLTMQFEHIGTDAIIHSLFTIVDRLIHFATYRSHGKGIVVGANMITKRFSNVILSSEQLEQLRWNRVKGWQDYLSTQAAHAKLGISIGG
jgi:hypothetical protein